MNHDGGEVAFELVARGRQVTLYLEDHGEPIPTAHIKGTLRLQRGSMTSTTKLKPSNGNRVVVQLPQALQKGDEIVADVSFANGSIAQAKFVYGMDVQLRKRQIGLTR